MLPSSPERLRWLLVGEGTSVHVRRLATALLEAGEDVHLACFEKADVPAETHVLPARSRGDARYPFAVPALRRAVRKIDPDVVNAHYLSSYGVMAALAGARMLTQTTWGTDVLVTARRPVRRALARYALDRAQLATGDSLSLLDGIRELSSRPIRHRFVFGPPLAAFDPVVAKEPLVVSPRRHEPPYRIATLLDAWVLARPHLPGYRLVVAGSGSLTRELRSRAGEGTEFVGELSHESMLDLLARAQLVVSIPDSDATSAALLEALASRCAVVATDVPANLEWVSSSRIVPTDPTPAVLARAIVEAVGDSPSLDRRWSFELQVRELMSVVREVTVASLRS